MIKVSTDKLRAGDKIHVNGVIILLGDTQPEVIERGRETIFRWPNAGIVSGHFDFAPKATQWTIQGNTWCFWRVTRGE